MSWKEYFNKYFYYFSDYASAITKTFLFGLIVQVCAAQSNMHLSLWFRVLLLVGYFALISPDIYNIIVKIINKRLEEKL